MTIETIILRELLMRLKAPFETSFGVTQARRILLVEAVVDGVSGSGEATTIESPFSTIPRLPDTAWHIISDFIAPRLVGKNLGKASDAAAVLSAIRGYQYGQSGR